MWLRADIDLPFEIVVSFVDGRQCRIGIGLLGLRCDRFSIHFGGLAAGALLGAALAAPHYYYGYEPVYYGPRCVFRHERFWDGWGWHVRRVEDCY
jgi:hypothetical protein